MKDAYWITFHGHASGCVEADTEENALAIAQEITGYDAATALILPHPANPRLNEQREDPKHIPSLCWRPEECAGRTSCPRTRPCND